MTDGLRLPASLTARPATRGDVAALSALIAACEQANDGVAEIHPDDIASLFDRLGHDTGDVIAVQGPADIVAWASRIAERAEADVHPAWRNRGIGRALLAWTEERARLAGLTRIRQTVTDADAAAGSLLEANGYAAGGSSWILQQTLGDNPPPIDVPVGVAIRSYRPEDARDVHRLIDDAFGEWPDRGPVAFDQWAPYAIGHGSFAPGLSRLAFAGDELVGAAVSLAYEGSDEGWIQQLATKASHRHRGIARALLLSVFAGFHAAGWRAAGLSTDSRTGALALYERLGMRVRRSYTWWIKPLA